MERINYMVVGVGINVNQEENDFPEEVRASATSLKAQTGSDISRVKLVQAFLLEFEKWYDTCARKWFCPGPGQVERAVRFIELPGAHSYSKQFLGWLGGGYRQ